ncbi:DUF4326 domain-containing protein [Pseudomonas piscis]|uniref:DUF4326 domain-containing protein n=1 Tax=Pseudomonas piscis TaxID=2614538 RepID=UPI0039A73143
MTDKSAYIAYHPAFKCQSKFDRKLNKILKSHRFKINYFEDPNGYIQDFCAKHKLECQKHENFKEGIYASTHAVFFEDRDCFFIQKQHVFDRDIPYRTIDLDLTIVVNRDRGAAYDVYIGRGTIWGNPYQMGIDGNREEVIQKFQHDFDKGLLKASADFDNNINPLRGKLIACHCKPAACHGDVIAEYLNALDDGK